jgi:hypothetical protein
LQSTWVARLNPLKLVDSLPDALRVFPSAPRSIRPSGHGSKSAFARV